jgi:hypothetical protein
VRDYFFLETATIIIGKLQLLRIQLFPDVIGKNPNSSIRDK